MWKLLELQCKNIPEVSTSLENKSRRLRKAFYNFPNTPKKHPSQPPTFPINMQKNSQKNKKSLSISHTIKQSLIFLNKILIFDIIFNWLLDFKYNFMIIWHILIVSNSKYFPIFCVWLSLYFLYNGQLFLFVLLSHYVLVDLFWGFCRTEELSE